MNESRQAAQTAATQGFPLGGTPGSLLTEPLPHSKYQPFFGPVIGVHLRVQGSGLETAPQKRGGRNWWTAGRCTLLTKVLCEQGLASENVEEFCVKNGEN